MTDYVKAAQERFPVETGDTIWEEIPVGYKEFYNELVVEAYPVTTAAASSGHLYEREVRTSSPTSAKRPGRSHR